MLRSTSFYDRPILTLQDLEAHDPLAPLGGRERRFLCPLAACAGRQRGERHRSLALNVESGLWTCHRCRAGGRLREHWPARRGSDRARSHARSAFRVATPGRSTIGHAAEGTSTAQVAYATAVPLVGTAGADYLTDRGIAVGLAAAAGVRYHLNFYGRPAVLFPLHDRSGALVAVNGRYVDGRSDPKARTAGRKRLGAFATPGALDAGELLLCEAPIDALSLAACGVPAIGLCGTSGPDWLAAACAYRRVALALDADDGGDRGAADLVPALAAFGAQVARRRPQGAKDWNELFTRGGAEAVRAQLEEGAER